MWTLWWMGQLFYSVLPCIRVWSSICVGLHRYSVRRREETEERSFVNLKLRFTAWAPHFLFFISPECLQQLNLRLKTNSPTIHLYVNGYKYPLDTDRGHTDSNDFMVFTNDRRNSTLPMYVAHMSSTLWRCAFSLMSYLIFRECYYIGKLLAPSYFIKEGFVTDILTCITV